jgi:hypothetical protein
MTPQQLDEMARGFQAAAVVLAANHAGMLRELCRKPQTADRLAGRLHLDRRAVATVIDALVCLGVVERDGPQLKVPEALRSALDPSSPTSSASAMDHHWYLLQRWAGLDSVLTTGEPLPRPRQDDARRRAFILAMADMARRSGMTLWEAADLSATTHLVDVGGGPGELALAALERFPALSATVFDRPEVLAIAREYAERRSVSARLRFHAGDALLDDIPPCDVALVSSLLHAYGPAGAQSIAAHVAAGVRGGGRVLIREFLWDDEAHSGPVSAALFAVNMLSGTAEGRCWTAAELEAIFGRAGFGEWRLERLDARTSLLTGVRQE